MSAIGAVFSRCREEKRAAFIPYLTGGDPDIETSAVLLEALVDGGADIIEVGVPFSDPIADGPVNQRAAVRALEAGVTLPGILEMVARLRTRVNTPIVLFSYFNPLLAHGVKTVAEQAALSGVDGILCVDLPPDESDGGFRGFCRSAGVDSIYLLAPTSTPERVKTVAEASSGFVYYVSRTGVTGVQKDLTQELLREVKKIRRKLDLPLAVGFGISSPEQVATVGKVADGVVVGSALVRLVEENRGRDDLPELLAAEVERLAAPLHQGRRCRKSTNAG
jgi:tryptophan synthase alpha chain